MPWITTKDGKHINTDWFDQDNKQKERQIAANKQQADVNNEKPAPSKKREKRNAQDLLVKDDYTNNAEYQQAQKYIRDNWEKDRELASKHLEAYKELERAEDKHADPKMVKLCGRVEARMFVNDEDYPDTAELRKKVDAINAEKKEIDEGIKKSRAVMELQDAKYSEIQRKEYGRPDYKEASGEYEGFKTNESTTSYVDRVLKEGKAKVVEMSPEQYIHECAHYIFTNSTVQKTLRSRLDNKDTDKYATMMGQGVKFDTPYIDYDREGQEGLHRAVAAYVNGIDKIPVIIIGRRR